MVGFPCAAGPVVLGGIGLNRGIEDEPIADSAASALGGIDNGRFDIERLLIAEAEARLTPPAGRAALEDWHEEEAEQSHLLIEA